MQQQTAAQRCDSGRIVAQSDRRDAAGGAASQRNVAIMKPGNPIGPAQAQAEPSTGFPSTKVGVEGMLACGIGKTGAAVGHMDHDAIWLADERDDDRALAANRFDRVAHSARIASPIIFSSTMAWTGCSGTITSSRMA